MRDLPPQAGRILLTGATGFVGRRLWGVLTRAGYEVVCLTRRVEHARARWPERNWVQGDAAHEDQLARAMEGCTAAYYLMHGMAEHAADFRRLERETAERFNRAGERAGLQRTIYLGGFAPQGPPTEHLASRLEVGEVLRSGAVPALELRASMIVGYGSLSWLMVRDLAARLPCMILPKWLKSRTQPVAVDDVLQALVCALSLEASSRPSFDLPGPEVLSGREILERTARVMGLSRPFTIEVPVLSPWLSSHWVHFVTRAEWSVAREVVIGMAHDFLARDGRFWELTGIRPMPFEAAARVALAEEAEGGEIPGFWGTVERSLRGRAVRAPVP